MDWFERYLAVVTWFEVLAKSSALLACAAVVALLLRRSRASLRAMLWAGAVTVAATTAVALAFWPQKGVQVAIAEASAALPSGGVQTVAPVSTQPVASAPASAIPPDPSWLEDLQTYTGIELVPSPLGRIRDIWLWGSLLVALWLALGIFGGFRMRRRASAIAWDGWPRALDDARQALAVRQKIAVHQSPGISAPMVCGIVFPVILVPPAAQAWSASCRDIVLRHELAHIRRRDLLVELVARFAVVVLWFNPLAWYALLRLRAERELAADDLVLHSGARASDYAGELLRVARAISKPQRWPLASLPMARSSRLGRRLAALLDPRLDRRPMSWRSVLAIAVLSAAIGAVLVMARPGLDARAAVLAEMRTPYPRSPLVEPALEGLARDFYDAASELAHSIELDEALQDVDSRVAWLAAPEAARAAFPAERAGRVVELLEKGTRARDGRSPLHPTQDLNDDFWLREIVRVARSLAWHRADHEDLRGATDVLTVLLFAAEDWGRGATLMGITWSAAVSQRVSADLLELARTNRLSESILAAAVERFGRALSVEPKFAGVARIEDLWYEHQFRDHPYSFVLPSRIGLSRPAYESLRVTADLPTYDRLTELQASYGESDWLYLPKYLLKWDGDRGYVRAVYLALACELFQRRHGQYPDSLDDLVPEIIATLPLNPVTARAFTYDGHSLQYSVLEIRSDWERSRGKPDRAIDLPLR